MFCRCFFSVHQNYETTVLGNGWTDFHETFIDQTIGGKCSLKRRAAAWRKSCRRLANSECWWFAMRQPFSGTAERIFMKLLPNDTGTKRYRGKCSLKRRAAAWRMANVYDCVIYDMTLSQSPEGATWFTLWLLRNHHRAPRTTVAL